MQNDNLRFETLTDDDLDAVNGGMMRNPTVPLARGGNQSGGGGSLLDLIDAILGVPQPSGSGTACTGGSAY
jgi:bacteriocin-like protein